MTLIVELLAVAVFAWLLHGDSTAAETAPEQIQ